MEFHKCAETVEEFQCGLNRPASRKRPAQDPLAGASSARCRDYAERPLAPTKAGVDSIRYCPSQTPQFRPSPAVRKTTSAPAPDLAHCQPDRCYYLLHWWTKRRRSARTSELWIACILSSGQVLQGLSLIPCIRQTRRVIIPNLAEPGRWLKNACCRYP